MRILVIGAGGREHAIGVSLLKSIQVEKIFFAPGNAGTAKIGQNINISVTDVDGLLAFAQKEKIDLTVVGPELPLSLGVVDRFEKDGLRIFGPTEEGARLETSKRFSKAFMKKYNIPTGDYEEFDDSKKAIEYLENAVFPLVIKADGLAAGKGVAICDTLLSAKNAVQEIMEDRLFGDGGASIIVEEFLEGKEVSLLCFTDGTSILPMESASDYKRAYDGDRGANTGGMGCISPSPYYLAGAYDNILARTLKGIRSEKFGYKGIIYIGLMMTKEGAKVLEYNVRFGDPETEVLLPRLQTDLLDILMKTIKGNLSQVTLSWNKSPAVTVVVASKGYPECPLLGGEIRLPQSEEVFVFHAGTTRENDRIVSSGGRVLAVTALGKDMVDAREKVYSYLETIDFEQGFYRTDIGEFDEDETSL